MAMAMPSPINPINYLINRQYSDTLSVRNDMFTRRLAKATNLFRKDLLSHYGCVNAIEFSNEGELLISGGDDRRVLLWSVPHAVLDKGQPVVMSTPHLSNIFCLGFDSTNSKIFSAGNDDQVIVHDSRTGYLLTSFLHEKPVYGLSVSPQNDYVFASAGEDGRILIYDIREPATDPLCLARHKTAFHAVMFNPVDPRFVATANTEEGIALWDNRKPKEHFIKYGIGTRQNSGMSVRFNSLGTQILALRRRLPPVLYSVHTEKPVCQFYHPDYYNSCTMKSCAFAGENDEYVLSGSDDFNLYMWKLPKNNLKWGTIHMVLVGHRSIVNQVRYNRQNNIFATSGVEKMVKLWSTIPVGGWKGSLVHSVPDKPRQVFSHDEYISLVQNNGQLVSHDYSHQSTQEDSRMMAFFDSLVQREIEGWVMSDESSSDSDYDSSSNLNYLSQVPFDYHRTFGCDRKGNRIAQLIYEKREKLARMAQQKGSSSTQRYKKREKQRKRKSSKLKSPIMIRSSSSSKKGSSSGRKTSSKHSTSKQSTTSSTSTSTSSTRRTNNSNTNNNSSTDRAPPSHKHKYKTRSNSAREREEVQSSESLDVPSTSTGITGSSSSVYRIYDQDSEEETNNVSNRPSPELAEQPLINILPTPLNGTHDMYINILQVPVTTNGNSVITVRNESAVYENNTADDNTAYTRADNNRDSDSSSAEMDNDNDISNTPIGKFHNCAALTPDSGIVTGPCSSSGSLNSVYSLNRPGSSSGTSNSRHLLRDDNSDDDWAYENFKRRVKRARFNLRNNVGCESDSN